MPAEMPAKEYCQSYDRAWASYDDFSLIVLRKSFTLCVELSAKALVLNAQRNEWKGRGPVAIRDATPVYGSNARAEQVAACHEPHDGPPGFGASPTR